MNVELTDIGKKYDQSWIFRGLSAEFKSNTIYGFVGQNGSGKSTLLQIVSGFVTPNEGQIDYTDPNISVDQVYRRLSMCTPYMELPVELTVEECIENQQRFKPYRNGHTISDILQITDLGDHRKKQLTKLSSGMKQRLKLALALLANSSLLLLDEPCSNLDSTWSAWFNRCLTENAQDRTIIICSNSQDIELQSVTTSLIDLTDFRP